MFTFSVAQLRLLILFTFFPFVFSHEKSLFTSSVTYCQPPESILVQQFDVAYIAKNHSVFFNISAASVEPNVSVTANLFFNVYGMHPVNFTIDLCTILDGGLCPLPMYNFTGSDSLRLPPSVNINDKIPPIAFQIPDLEAFAQFTLRDVRTGKLKACMQATVSNGWSARQQGVEWATRAFALASFLFAFFSDAPCRFVDLILLFQAIASSGFLNLNYPSAYTAYTLNFAWSMGLFYPPNLQKWITNMRRLTGGKIGDGEPGGNSAIGFVNRKLSPYNALNTFRNPNLLPAARFGTADFPTGEVVTVTPASPNVLQAGVPIYVNSLGIATPNAFMTLFFALIMFALGALIFFALVCAGLALARRYRSNQSEPRKFPSLVYAWALRFSLLAFTPVLVLAFYQWTLKDSGLSVMLSVILIGLLPGFVIYNSTVILRTSPPQALYDTPQHVDRQGPLFFHYRIPRYYFFFAPALAAFAKALFIAFAKQAAVVQLALVITTELFLLLALVILRPYKRRGGDVLAAYVATTRLVAALLSIALLQNLALKPIPRVVIGIVIAVLFSVAVVVMFVDLVISLARALSRVAARRESSGEIAVREESALEKAVEETAVPARSLDGSPPAARDLSEKPSVEQLSLDTLDWHLSSSFLDQSRWSGHMAYLAPPSPRTTSSDDSGGDARVPNLGPSSHV